MTKQTLFIITTPLRWFRKLYDWTLRWAQSPKATCALFIIAFIESSFFLIPPDTLLILMTVAQPHYWWRNAAICTIGSVLGGVLGYFIGWGLYETIGRPLVEFYDLSTAIAAIGDKYAEHAFLAVFSAAFTPIPYKAFTIAAGLFAISLPTLVVGSLLGRAGRFFAVALALRIWGEKISRSIEKYFDLFSLMFLLLLVVGFVTMRYL